MLIAQRQHQTVVSGRGLQLEIESPAETLTQRQSPGAIDWRSERRMDDELHSSAFIEEALGDDHFLAGDRAERPFTRAHVFDGLFRAASIEPAFPFEQGNSIAGGCHSHTQPGNFTRQLTRAAGSFAAPEGDRWGRAMRILHANSARLDPADAPGRRAKQKYVSGEALDCEVLVQGSDDGSFRLGDDLILRRIGNSAA